MRVESGKWGVERRQLRLVVVLCALFLALIPGVARAEGPTSGGTRIYISDTDLGAFKGLSFAAPNPPVTTDRLWVSVQVRDGARAVADAKVWVTVSNPATAYSERMEAVHDLAATPFDYTAAIAVPDEGQYTVKIEMEHPSGNGEMEYVVNVTKPLTNTIFLMMLGPAVLIAAFLIHRFVVRLPAPAAILAGDDSVLTEENKPR